VAFTSSSSTTIPATVARLTGSQTFTGSKIFTQPILLGALGDAAISRKAAAGVRVDDSLFTKWSVVVDDGDVGGKLYFGSALDTNLYREAVDKLRTDDSLHVVGNLTVDGTFSALGYIDAGTTGASLVAAVAGASAGQCVLLRPGVTYTLTSTLILPVGVSLFSPSPYRGAYSSGGALVTGAISPLIQFSTVAGFDGKQSIEGITFRSTAGGTNAYIFYYDFNGSGISWLRFYDCMFDMGGSTATNRGAIWYNWSNSGTVEQVYYEHCGFNGCDTAIGGSDPTFTSDWDKCVIEKCRFDNCRGSAAMPAQVYFNIAFCRGGAIRDCVFEGATNNARAAIFLGMQFQAFTIENTFIGGMASQLNNTYDEVIVADPPGVVTAGGRLLITGCRFGDRELSTNAVRYSINLEAMGGSFIDPGGTLIESAVVMASSVGVIRYSRAYGTPANSVKIFASNATVS
jgi:hypothetical protein